MSDIRYTPGPWKAFNASWSETFITAPGFDHAICCLDINHATEESQESDSEQMAANARLIAAAPELLEALQEMLHIMEQHEQLSGCECSIGDEARSAIAKATGNE